jgi:cation diffusion facilitator CzcD-associated flavoprotein CzcO
VESTSLVVIGAGPYGVATAARAMEQGIDTVVFGRPMSFWTDHMPSGMFLRSGLDWHLDAAGIHTFEAFVDDARIRRADLDPIPISVFLDYAAWFLEEKGIVPRDDLVVDVTKSNGRFEVLTGRGVRIAADSVVVAPGIAFFETLPDWAALVPEGLSSHTCDLVDFDRLRDRRVLIVGGRQSAYEWAALIGEAGAERIDIVHRHDEPRFERVSWKFVDPYMEETVRVPGWWRRLPQAERDAISRQFWSVGRLTLEWWLTPRLTSASIHRRPGTSVVEVLDGPRDGEAMVTLSTGDQLVVDYIVYATGYTGRIENVPYLNGVIERVETADGFPILDEAQQSTCSGLYFTGFSATHDFGPFFGFTRGCPVAAKLVAADLASR